MSVMLDRKSGGPLFIASAEGGVNIEETAKTNPDAIKKMAVDPSKGLDSESVRKFAESLGFTGDQVAQCSKIIENVYKFFCERDLTMMEVNPLATLADNRVIVLDAKVSIDDNASYRQQDLEKIIDKSSQDAQEAEAGKYGLNFIKLDGNIGCLVNGAGLAMATMDIIKLHGGSPANFLDVGGGAEEEGVDD
jgi:succinyl-CoA synthetase beta subunit